MQKEFVGQNFRNLMGSLQKKHGFKMTLEEEDHYVERELRELIESLEAECEPCVNANEVLAKLQKEGKYGMSIVSSSALPRVKASIKKAGQNSFFDEDKIYSAATSLPVPTSKPDPAVYLFACEKLGVKPQECLAIEDSRSGATAAMRAGINLLGYTGACYDREEMEVTAKILTHDCKALAIMEDWKDFPAILEKIEKM
jgi:HAD superfamily hydrolase (TIGR01509 family)